ncbi:PREDICTED: doublecortin domain-containing protein 2C isoform X1 [Rhinopithecus bieti]|uniref:doublecortin domain-containing protein 2C isoform X1 n=1 Tax=Rhinopithecus bieti TaxID=61621 RepID=UPI00083C3AEC|nr:PREDICTED: doublecortin domain-containing protein 2C isoform X1 [Rhinopithecus bieti]
MGTRGPSALVDTTPAKTIVVYRNGDPFYVGKKFVLSRRGAATFEALLEQLTEQVDVPFGVRRLFTPTRGHRVLGLDALQAGGKYVAAGRERFKELDYIHIVPRKPAKIRKLKEIKPVVHCDINVPSKWQTYHRISRHIKLFTMNGHLLCDSKDLQDNHFYVAAGLETFKYFPYWKSPRVPSEVQQRYANVEKKSQRKKKVDSKGKEPCHYDGIPPKTQDSVYYAKEEKKKALAEPLVQRGAGDVQFHSTKVTCIKHQLLARKPKGRWTSKRTAMCSWRCLWTSFRHLSLYQRTQGFLQSPWLTCGCWRFTLASQGSWLF